MCLNVLISKLILLIFLDNLNCISGSIRLVDGQSSKEGRIQYCVNGQWYPYCTSYGLTQKTASLICQQLGHTQSCKL